MVIDYDTTRQTFSALLQILTGREPLVKVKSALVLVSSSETPEPRAMVIEPEESRLAIQKYEPSVQVESS